MRLPQPSLITPEKKKRKFSNERGIHSVGLVSYNNIPTSCSGIPQTNTTTSHTTTNHTTTIDPSIVNANEREIHSMKLVSHNDVPTSRIEIPQQTGIQDDNTPSVPPSIVHPPINNTTTSDPSAPPPTVHPTNDTTTSDPSAPPSIPPPPPYFFGKPKRQEIVLGYSILIILTLLNHYVTL